MSGTDSPANSSVRIMPVPIHPPAASAPSSTATKTTEMKIEEPDDESGPPPPSPSQLMSGTDSPANSSVRIMPVPIHPPAASAPSSTATKTTEMKIEEPDDESGPPPPLPLVPPATYAPVQMDTTPPIVHQSNVPAPIPRPVYDEIMQDVSGVFPPSAPLPMDTTPAPALHFEVTEPGRELMQQVAPHPNPSLPNPALPLLPLPNPSLPEPPYTQQSLHTPSAPLPPPERMQITTSRGRKSVKRTADSEYPLNLPEAQRVRNLSPLPLYGPEMPPEMPPALQTEDRPAVSAEERLPIEGPKEIALRPPTDVAPSPSLDRSGRRGRPLSQMFFPQVTKRAVRKSRDESL